MFQDITLKILDVWLLVKISRFGGSQIDEIYCSTLYKFSAVDRPFARVNYTRKINFKAVNIGLTLFDVWRTSIIDVRGWVEMSYARNPRIAGILKRGYPNGINISKRSVTSAPESYSKPTIASSYKEFITGQNKPLNLRCGQSSLWKNEALRKGEEELEIDVVSNSQESSFATSIDNSERKVYSDWGLTCFFLLYFYLLYFYALIRQQCFVV